jgi:hypothetical protein
MKRLEDMNETELGILMSGCAQVVMAHLRENVLPPDNGRHQFALVVFNDPKIAQYVSSCDRSSMISAMKETAARLEAKEDVTR